MAIKDNKLYSLVDRRHRQFESWAKEHKRLHRLAWWATTLVSLTIAFTSNYEFGIAYGIESSHIASVLGIVLPAITAYIVLRSPERLWIFEISMRNRLSDLKDRIELAYEKDPDVDTSAFEDQYLGILAEANERWVDIKQDGN